MATRKKKAAETAPDTPPVLPVTYIAIDNIKRIRRMELKLPGAGMTRVTGANGAGKSTFIDCFAMLLHGGANIPEGVVSVGETRGVITCMIGDDLRLTRRLGRGQRRDGEDFNKNGVLTLENLANGSIIRGVQEVLKKLCGLALDPLRFMRADDKWRSEQMRRLVPSLDEPITELDAALKEDYQLRRELDRSIVPLETRIAGIQVIADLPAELIDVGAIGAQLAEAGKANAERQRVLAEVERVGNRVARMLGEAMGGEEKVKRLRREADDLEQQVSGIRAELKELENTRIEIPGEVDTTDLERQIATANNINQAIGRRQSREALDRELAEVREKVRMLTARRERMQADRVKIIAEANWPVPGLGLSEAGEVTYNGIPFELLSDGEKITVSASLAMSPDSQVRIAWVKDASLLDEKHLAILARIAEERSYQLLVELVGVAGGDIQMENGKAVTHAG